MTVTTFAASVQVLMNLALRLKSKSDAPIVVRVASVSALKPVVLDS